ncbi:DUF5677 domain-containing protein [Erwiniaceae bacterium BAC15a-03b]|uniref:DUF5677 domain-containing protein n=1 Tax=Winslowiella arboricola TaxID=2978220 RepID=A0A9J6PKD5_9GAMM|nr:DUF5677 domain-containing protein [Winslowiella arboricola]MCU5773071.1 DUF5677 domain-containing protein [Winslowiella arboricola]MCU5777834.1 DUF5677 domain-containing protein [Winslowiella arboricola]
MTDIDAQIERILIERATNAINSGSEFELEKELLTVVVDYSEKIIINLNAELEELISKNHEQNLKFTENHYGKWKPALDKLEMLITTCIESGSKYNEKKKDLASEYDDVYFYVLIRLHAKACHVSNEILYLLKGGYADGAHARWRALHEINVTLIFISKHGTECAERFYFHEMIDSFNMMKSVIKYEDRLQVKGSGKEVYEDYETVYKELLIKYGKDFEQQYGWANIYFPDIKKPGFQSLEKDVGLDHMRPYFKWASQNIHTSFKSISKNLSLPFSQGNELMVVGPSNYGLTDPADATALSIAQATCCLLVNTTNYENVVLASIISTLSEKIGRIFHSISNCNDFESKS